jgi:hypothetical protein
MSRIPHPKKVRNPDLDRKRCEFSLENSPRNNRACTADNITTKYQPRRSTYPIASPGHVKAHIDHTRDDRVSASTRSQGTLLSFVEVDVDFGSTVVSDNLLLKSTAQYVIVGLVVVIYLFIIIIIIIHGFLSLKRKKIQASKNTKK